MKLAGMTINSNVLGVAFFGIVLVFFVVTFTIEKRNEDRANFLAFQTAYKNKDVNLFFSTIVKIQVHNRVIDSVHIKISDFCKELTVPEDIVLCLEHAADSYSPDLDVINDYLDKYGDSFVLSLLSNNIISNSNLDDVVSKLNLDTIAKYPDFKLHYENKFNKLQENIQAKSYLKIKGSILGRMRMNDPLTDSMFKNGTVKQAGAIIQYNGKNVVIGYTLIDQDYIDFSLSLVDTYEEKQKVFNKLTHIRFISPQDSPYFSGIVYKEDYTVSSAQNQYDFYSICYEGEEDKCAQYCASDGTCNHEESYSSISARQEMNSLAEIFSKFGIASIKSL